MKPASLTHKISLDDSFLEGDTSTAATEDVSSWVVPMTFFEFFLSSEALSIHEEEIEVTHNVERDS